MTYKLHPAIASRDVSRSILPHQSRNWKERPSTESEVSRATQEIGKARLRILRHPVFRVFSGAVVCGKNIVSDDAPTAQTDGWVKMYNPQMVLDFAKADRAGRLVNMLVLHEAVHGILGHCLPAGPWVNLFRTRRRLHARAIDVVVNTYLWSLDSPNNEFLQFPNWCVAPQPWAYGLSAGTVANRIMQSAQNSGTRTSDSGSNEAKDVRYHPSMDDGDGDYTEVSMDEHKMGDPKHAPEQNQVMVRSMRAGASARRLGAQMGLGGIGGHSDDAAQGLIDSLLAPRRSYIEAVREWMEMRQIAGVGSSTWARPNRRFLHQRMILPGSCKQQGGELAVALDTSGSIWHMLQQFLSELAQVLVDMKPSKVHVMCVDTRVRSYVCLEPHQMHNILEHITCVGQGGTVMPAVFDYMKAHGIRPAGTMIFTDMETSWPSHAQCEGYPHVWVSTNLTLAAPTGTTIYMDDASLSYTAPTAQEAKPEAETEQS